MTTYDVIYDGEEATIECHSPCGYSCDDDCGFTWDQAKKEVVDHYKGMVTYWKEMEESEFLGD